MLNGSTLCFCSWILKETDRMKTIKAKKRTIRDIEEEIKALVCHENLSFYHEVLVLINQLRNRNQPKVALLRKELAALHATKKHKKPRWPENTPEEVIRLCDDYWRGSSEAATYRIHCWNELAVWTSYPSGGFSDNGGSHPSPSRYFLLSRKTKESRYGRQSAATLKEISYPHKSGLRVTPKRMQAELDELKAAK